MRTLAFQLPALLALLALLTLLKPPRLDVKAIATRHEARTFRHMHQLDFARCKPLEKHTKG